MPPFKTIVANFGNRLRDYLRAPRENGRQDVFGLHFDLEVCSQDKISVKSNDRTARRKPECKKTHETTIG